MSWTNASVLTLHPTQCPFHHTLPHTMPLPLHHAPYNAPSFTQCPTQCPCPHTLPHTMPLPSYHVSHSAPAFSLCPHKTLFLSSLSFSLSKHPEQHCLLKYNDTEWAQGNLASLRHMPQGPHHHRIRSLYFLKSQDLSPYNTKIHLFPEHPPATPLHPTFQNLLLSPVITRRWFPSYCSILSVPGSPPPAPQISLKGGQQWELERSPMSSRLIGATCLDLHEINARSLKNANLWALIWDHLIKALMNGPGDVTCKQVT